jgi:hypothetical protein
MQVTRKIAAGLVTSQAALHYLIPTSSKITSGMKVGVIGYSPLHRINHHLQFYCHDVPEGKSAELADSIYERFFKNQKMISIGSVLEANSIAAANYSTVTGMVGSPVIALDSCELVGIHVGCVHAPQNYNNFITVHHKHFVYSNLRLSCLRQLFYNYVTSKLNKSFNRCIIIKLANIKIINLYF